MSININYNGNNIASLEDTKTAVIECAGKKMTDDLTIIVTETEGGECSGMHVVEVDELPSAENADENVLYLYNDTYYRFGTTNKSYHNVSGSFTVTEYTENGMIDVTNIKTINVDIDPPEISEETIEFDAPSAGSYNYEQTDTYYKNFKVNSLPAQDVTAVPSYQSQTIRADSGNVLRTVEIPSNDISNVKLHCGIAMDTYPRTAYRLYDGLSTDGGMLRRYYTNGDTSTTELETGYVSGFSASRLEGEGQHILKVINTLNNVEYRTNYEIMMGNLCMISINGEKYGACDNMTWRNWINSSFNPSSKKQETDASGNYKDVYTKDYTIGADGFVWYRNEYQVIYNGNSVRATHLIVAGEEYAHAAIIHFTIDGISCRSVENITWEQWITTNLNNNDFIINDLGDFSVISIGEDYYYLSYNDNFVLSTEYIVADRAYTGKHGPAGLYDANNNLVATWDTLVNTYGMDVSKNYTYSNYATDIASPHYVLANNAELASGAKLIIENVTSIGDYALDECVSLQNVVMPNTVTSIGKNAFYGCEYLEKVVIPDGITKISDLTFCRCYRLANIMIPNSVTSIGPRAFDGCSGLTSITLSDNLTTIGYETFSNCINLTNIAIPDTVTSIGTKAFYNCTSLMEIVVPEGITSINSDTFYDCSSLTSITIPDSVTNIGKNAFRDCSSLTNIIIPDSVTSIADCAFYNCSSLTSITIPDSITSIRYEVFRGCSSLTSITIPDTVTSISGYAFHGCSSLTSIDIPSGITFISGGLFYDCRSLTSITIPEGVTSIGSMAFKYCYGLTDIVIPNSVTYIDLQAFCVCSSLTSITLPASVTSIDEDVFWGCSNLTSITFEGTVEQWNAITKSTEWNDNASITKVVCSDGEVAL